MLGLWECATSSLSENDNGHHVSARFVLRSVRHKVVFVSQSVLLYITLDYTTFHSTFIKLMNMMQLAQLTRSLRLVLLLFIPLLSVCKKAIDPGNSAVVGEVFTVVDQPPAFQGGQTELNNYLMKNLRYPAEAQRAKIQGKVVVGFIVTDAGRIADVQIKQSVGGGCDEEATRVVKAMPNWVPGQLKGKPVNVQTSLPFSFTLL